MNIPIYWMTKWGALCERQAGPDLEGRITVRRLFDNSTHEWNIADMRPLTTAEALALASREGL